MVGADAGIGEEGASEEETLDLPEGSENLSGQVSGGAKRSAERSCYNRFQCPLDMEVPRS